VRKFVNLIVVAITCSTALPAIDRIALGQAGSIGGTVGKTDKSASGGEDRTGRSTLTKPGHNVKGSPCAKAVGVWAWFDGGTAIIKSDGTATGGTVTANWSCINGQVVITWSNGYNDRLSISADGNHLEGTNGMIRVFGDRK
jgi:hypothetical protein